MAKTMLINDEFVGLCEKLNSQLVSKTALIHQINRGTNY